MKKRKIGYETKETIFVLNNRKQRLFLLEKMSKIAKNSTLLLFLVGIMTTIIGSAQSAIYNPWNINDDDEIYLGNPSNLIVIVITGDIFKAIDPKFIANKYGSTKTSIGFSQKNKVFKKTEKSKFSLITFDTQFDPNYKTKNLFTAQNAQQKWRYHINKKSIVPEYAGVISALMPQAIERIEFIPSDRYLRLPKIAAESAKKHRGDIHIYTRDISKSVINDSTTVYILNDKQVITRKIYEAINPVFFRSLTRITDKAELADYGYENATEIVKINLYKFEEVIDTERVKYKQACPACEVYLVDGIKFDFDTYILLKKFHFEEIREIIEDEEDAFAPYQDFFPQEELSDRKRITIVSLSDNANRIADNDTIYLSNPENLNQYPITGEIFKAIDPKYIANTYGYTRKEIVVFDTIQTILST